MRSKFVTQMWTKIRRPFLVLAMLSFVFQSRASEQNSLTRVNQMANVPQPLKIIDFKALAFDFDKTVYSFDHRDEHWPLVWIDKSGKNYKQAVVGLYTAIGDARQGPLRNGGMFHESLATMGSILGATLVGIDKSKQDFNYVGMIRNYFNTETGWNIVQNNTTPAAGALGGGYARDWWYDVFPNVLFYAIYEKYPNEPGFEAIARSVADRFYEADRILDGNYQYSFFDYAKMKPVKSHICAQADVAAGHSWVLYSAYKKFGDARYLQGALSSLKSLERNRVNPTYEVLMPFGAYMAARLNAELGTDYNVKKLLKWSFEPTVGCRDGWGTIVGKWNGFDVSGIVGSATDHGGYGFLMNTYDMAWPVVPMVRYDQSYANVIGKWMLNAANAAKLFYPQHIPAEHQTLPHLAHVTKGVIAYEGLVRYSTHDQFKKIKAPVAQGDGPKWLPENGDVTQFSVYGSAHVGIFGSIIKQTNVEGILQLDLLATDFFRDKAYPSFLYYNPYKIGRTVEVILPAGNSFDLYDKVSGKFLGKNATGSVSLTLPARTSAVLVLVPNNAVLKMDGKKLRANGVVIDYHVR